MIEKMLEKLEELRMRYFLTIANGGDEKLDFAYGYIGKTIDECKEIVQEVAKDGGWIPCSERLPEKNGSYLVTQERYSLDTHRLLGIETDFVQFSEGNWCRAKFLNVIAWQPLPAPYRKGEPHE